VTRTREGETFEYVKNIEYDEYGQPVIFREF
jgi:hypothetical protein